MPRVNLTYLLDVVDSGENSLAPLHQNSQLFSEFSLAHRSAGVHTMHLTIPPILRSLLLSCDYDRLCSQQVSEHQSEYKINQVVGAIKNSLDRS